MLTLYETYSASDMANIFDVRVADLDFGDQDGLHNLLLAKNGNVLFVYNLDTTNGDLDFVSADKFVWRVRGGQKRISTNPSSPGNLLIAGTTTMNDVTASSNVILIEDEPGNYADILRKNLKPDRAEQDKTSTVFLFVTSSLRPQLLYVGQLWFNQVGWHFRRVDGSPLPEPQGTHEFIVLPRLPKDVWTEAHGFLWRFRVGYELYEAYSVQEMIRLLAILDGDAPVVGEVTSYPFARYEEDSLIIFIAYDKAILVYNRFEFILNPDYDGDPDLWLEPSVFRYENGQSLDCPAAVIIPRDWAMTMFREYIQTGVRPAGVQWKSFNFYV